LMFEIDSGNLIDEFSELNNRVEPILILSLSVCG